MRDKLKRKIRQWRGVSLVVLGTTGAIVILRLTGLLQLLELSAFDQLLRLRSPEPADPRIVIIGVGESDLKYLGRWPMADRTLAQLLGKVKQQQPRAIGLDLYRDLPVEPGYEELVEVMKSTPNLVGIQKVVAGIDKSAIAPPPALEELGQVSADFPLDVDGKVRRALLYLNSGENEIVYSLGFRLAWLYLAAEKIEPEQLATNDDRIKLGKAIFSPFHRNDGGYAWADDRGYQILINYRGAPGTFPIVALSDVLEDRIEPDVFRDRIVLIGAITESLEDISLTPYSSSLVAAPERMPGVEVHANITSSLIGAALEGRALLKTGREPVEWLWILASAAIGVLWVCCWRYQQGLAKLLIIQTLARFVLASAVLTSGAYLAILAGWWVPIVPLFLVLVGSAIAQIGWTLIENLKLSYKQIENYASTLEVKVEQRTQELKHQNDRLEQALEQLQAAQKQMIAQEKLASLGSLAAGIAHEIRNPLNFVNNFAALAIELAEELALEIESTAQHIAAESAEEIDEMFVDLKECVDNIHKHGQRIENIVQSMLMHARQERGEIERVNINTLLADSVQLVSKNLHIKDPEFQLAIDADYDRTLENIAIIPQDISRALIAIIDNACYAMRLKQEKMGQEFAPNLSLKTLNLGDLVKISVRDNGLGIPQDVLDCIFNPFFTTKPPGEGTGLGLSLAHDTIVSVHRGQLNVDTSLGAYTEFAILLPKQQQSNSQEGS